MITYELISETKFKSNFHKFPKDRINLSIEIPSANYINK